MAQTSTTSEFVKARIAGTTARIMEINAQMNALRMEREELNETREDLRRQLLEAMGEELKAEQLSGNRKVGK